uniref:ethanolamine kinase n=2 Tax=Denticeps clupeoides TaxID=299321 RepID=A0AAY4DHB5_9TELE
MRQSALQEHQKQGIIKGNLTCKNFQLGQIKTEMSTAAATVFRRHDVGLLHLDIFVEEDEPSSGVMKLLKSLRPQWKPEDIGMKVFTEGITNQLMCCYVGSRCDSGAVLVRIYGQKTELFVDRDREVEMFQLLHEHGCGPQIFCSFQNGICYEFVQGITLDESALRQPAVYRLIAAEMGRLHAIKSRMSSVPAPVLWTKISRLLQLVKESLKDTSTQQRRALLQEVPSVHILSCEMEELKQHLGHVDSLTVVCHNDLLTKNIIYNHNQGCVKFIDYEYADFNYQAYDIANHFNEFAGVMEVDYRLYPSWELQKDWLFTYLETFKRCTGLVDPVTEHEVQELYIKVCKFSQASHFNWGLWAILQATYSTINFDFVK